MITALGAGDDEYLTKPCDRYNLGSNLDAIIRRTHGYSPAIVNAGKLIRDFSHNYAKVGNAWLYLKAKEFGIIEFLALHRGEVLSKDAFLIHLYGDIDELGPKIIDVFICKLRRNRPDVDTTGMVIDTI